LTAEASGPADLSPASAVPEWLAKLAEQAGRMRVHEGLRPPTSGGRPAAVLILFGVGAAGPDLLLIQRAARLRSHPGQPAFPGGSIDQADGGPVQAALREAAEETGVVPAGVQVLTVMPELYIARTGFRVTPVLAWWRSPVPVVPGDPAEIAAAVRVPVADLANPANRLTLVAPSGYLGPAFSVAGLLVWGFTALLLDRLLALGGWEQPWDHGAVLDLPAGGLPTGWPPETV
jgi:8-oxo-dGTP pyrophosphatase MutT (NUDIX family)